MKTRVIVIALALLLVASIAPTSAQSVGLVNPDFEQGFTVRGSNEIEVATGWEVSYLEGDHPFCRRPCHRPEFKPESQPRYITNGNYSQRWFSTFARQFGVIWQRVRVQPGQWYRFSCDAYVISEPPGGHAAFVGIQPWGANVFGRQMIWGQELRERNAWRRVSVTAQAWGDQIVVALGTNNDWETRNNTAYFDACTIERVELGGECPECPDCPECPECPGCPPCGGEGCDYDRIGEVLRGVLESMTWRAQ